jgi:hypothetical protein
MSNTNNTDKENWPTAGFRPPVGPYEQYNQLKQAVTEYIEQSDREVGIERALAAIQWKQRRDQFVDGHHISGPADKACIARLIGGYDECPHNHVTGEHDDPAAPPHSPPASDHPTLWLGEDGDPALYSMHVYQMDLEHDVEDGPDNRRFQLVDFARHFGLEIGVRDSWYNPGSCQQIVYYPPERHITQTDPVSQ